MPRRPALLQQLLNREDRLGLGASVQSRQSRERTPRTATADRVVDSVCPYCAVGCGQKLYVADEKIVHIEGDPASPISRGRLCPRGSSSLSLVTSPTRETHDFASQDPALRAAHAPNPSGVNGVLEDTGEAASG